MMAHSRVEHRRYGRKEPYTTRGIERLPCFRCGAKARYQWQVCSDGRLFRTLCADCDVALNVLVLKWMGFRDWRTKLMAYKKRDLEQ